MKAENYNIHVKTQEISQSIRFGESYLFQYGSKSKGYDKEIFDECSPHQFVCFVRINMQDKVGQVRAVVPLSLLHENALFGPPQIERLKVANKLAVYMQDLMKYQQEFLFEGNL